MKKYLTTLLTFAICAMASAQKINENQTFNLSRHDFCDTIPIVFEDNQVYVPVTIYGKRHLFLLDTGNPQGMVSEGASLGGWSELGNVVSTNADNTKDTVRVVSLPPFTMGSMTVSDYVATVSPDGASSEKYDAIIGFDLFNNGLFGKIDVERGVLILTDDARAFDREQGFVLKYKLKWFVPFVLVSPFIRHVDEARLALGSRQLYAMNNESLAKHAYKSKNVGGQVVDKATDIVTGDSVTLLALDRLRWDKFEFIGVSATTTNGSSRIGAPILKYGTIAINPFRKRVTFTPYNHGDTARVGNKPLQMAFIPLDGETVVAIVFPKSEAYRDGVRQGDTLLAVDGEAVSSFHHLMGYPLKVGTEYTFTMRDQRGRVKNIKIRW